MSEDEKRRSVKDCLSFPSSSSSSSSYSNSSGERRIRRNVKEGENGEEEQQRHQNPTSATSLSGISENEHDFESLEYEEDVYYRDVAATPSFDDIDELSDSDEIVVHCWRGSSGDIEEIVVDDSSLYCLTVETTDFPLATSVGDEDEDDDDKTRNDRKLFGTGAGYSNRNTNNHNNNNGFSNSSSNSNNSKKKKKKSVRVIFQDLSKPYLAKISSSQNYKKFLEIVKGEEASPHSPADPLSSPTDDFVSRGILEERELHREQWSAELAKVEEEIQTLRHVLASKVKASQDLKRKLGIGAWKELTDDVNQGLRNVKESQVFQKTESVIKTTAEKTTSILGGFSSGITMKLGQMRNSESFRSLEERVGSAYENVKTKVVPSRSNSTQSFDEALKEAEATRRASAAPSATSPTIPEDKLLS